MNRVASIGLKAILSCCCLLAGCGTDRVDGLIDQLGHADVKVRRAAARQLADLGREAEPAVPALNDAITDQDREVRRLAIHAISQVGPQADSFLQTLINALDDDELSVRLAAALAINRIAPDEDAHQEVLVSAMKMGEGGIIVAVGQAGENSAWAVPTLIGLLVDSRPGIRRITANSLEQIGPAAEAAKEALQQAAQSDPDDRVRGAADRALQKIGHH
jgi:HEAT repeat protein